MNIFKRLFRRPTPWKIGASEIKDRLLRTSSERINDEVFHSLYIVRLLDELRQGSAESVTFHQPNDDFGGPQEMIVVNGEWTNWEDREFTGNTILECLQAALLAKRAAQPKP